MTHMHPEDRWADQWAETQISNGPDRVVTDDPDLDFVRRRVGFAPPSRETEPLLRDGDNA